MAKSTRNASVSRRERAPIDADVTDAGAVNGRVAKSHARRMRHLQAARQSALGLPPPSYPPWRRALAATAARAATPIDPSNLGTWSKPF
jgi:hypothetical protein